MGVAGDSWKGKELQSEGGMWGFKTPNTEQCRVGEGVEQIKRLGGQGTPRLSERTPTSQGDSRLHFQRDTCVCGNAGHHWSVGLQGNFII